MPTPARACPSRPTSRRRPTQRPAPAGARPSGAARPAASSASARAWRPSGRRRLLRRPARAHALPDRVHPGRRRGEGRRALRPVPGLGPTRSSCSPTAGTRSRRAARRPTPRVERRHLRPRGALAGAARVASGRAAVGRRGGRRLATRCGSALAAAAPDVELVPGRGLDRGGPGGQGARRDRADRGRLRGRRPGARGAPAGDPARASRSATLALRLEWLMRDGWRGGARLRRRLPGRARGGAAARVARATAPVARRAGAPVRLRGAGRGLPERHDPDAVRRRAGGARPGGLRARARAPRRRRSRRCEAARRGGRRRCRTGARSTPPARDVIEAAGHGPALRARDWATGSASPPTSCRASARAAGGAAAQPDGLLRRARHLPRRRDRRPDRGPRPLRRGARPASSG